MPDYDEANPTNAYADTMYKNELPFLEADEDESLNTQQMFRGSTCIVSDSTLHQHQKPPHPQYVIDERPQHQYVDTVSSVQVIDGYAPIEPYTEYCPSDESSWYTKSDRLQRRRSRDSVENDLSLMQTDEHHRRRPETMRSISEDTQSRTAKQTIPRRTFSHPEPEMQNVRRIGNELQPTVPSPNPFGDLKERKKLSKLPSPRCKNFKSTDVYDTSPSSGEFSKKHIDFCRAIYGDAAYFKLFNKQISNICVT